MDYSYDSYLFEFPIVMRENDIQTDLKDNAGMGGCGYKHWSYMHPAGTALSQVSLLNLIPFEWGSLGYLGPYFILVPHTIVVIEI
jgi:hypothetical protein